MVPKVCLGPGRHPALVDGGGWILARRVAGAWESPQDQGSVIPLLPGRGAMCHTGSIMRSYGRDRLAPFI